MSFGAIDTSVRKYGALMTRASSIPYRARVYRVSSDVRILGQLCLQWTIILTRRWYRDARLLPTQTWRESMNESIDINRQSCGNEPTAVTRSSAVSKGLQIGRTRRWREAGATQKARVHLFTRRDHEPCGRSSALATISVRPRRSFFRRFIRQILVNTVGDGGRATSHIERKFKSRLSRLVEEIDEGGSQLYTWKDRRGQHLGALGMAPGGLVMRVTPTQSSHMRERATAVNLRGFWAGGIKCREKRVISSPAPHQRSYPVNLRDGISERNEVSFVVWSILPCLLQEQPIPGRSFASTSIIYAKKTLLESETGIQAMYPTWGLLDSPISNSPLERTIYHARKIQTPDTLSFCGETGLGESSVSTLMGERPIHAEQVGEFTLAGIVMPDCNMPSQETGYEPQAGLNGEDGGCDLVVETERPIRLSNDVDLGAQRREQQEHSWTPVTENIGASCDSKVVCSKSPDGPWGRGGREYSTRASLVKCSMSRDFLRFEDPGEVEDGITSFRAEGSNSRGNRLRTPHAMNSFSLEACAALSSVSADVSAECSSTTTLSGLNTTEARDMSIFGFVDPVTGNDKSNATCLPVQAFLSKSTRVEYGKRRRTAVACDGCNARKVRCTPANDPLINICRKCLASGTDCTFPTESFRGKLHAKDNGMVTELYRARAKCKSFYKGKVVCSDPQRAEAKRLEKRMRMEHAGADGIQFRMHDAAIIDFWGNEAKYANGLMQLVPSIPLQELVTLYNVRHKGYNKLHSPRYDQAKPLTPPVGLKLPSASLVGVAQPAREREVMVDGNGVGCYGESLTPTSIVPDYDTVATPAVCEVTL
ncbi:hypothetical protein BV25DRAFT_1835445 [Artomyces pyxidatus]|uniref:Uncharacterized protein n=1 Tax=Artomyces pyxidatus TaxID=48021 RepID=A0ACB8TFC1_9AGAM|nr:hypothetical protein BV25DRAFT_1835445 [Artomyces pyxidatus]